MTNKPLKMLIVIFVLVSILCITVGALSKMGSTGSEVSKIQSRLKEWGYYDGTVDGIYGIKTRDAVIKFQILANIINMRIYPQTDVKRKGI